MAASGWKRFWNAIKPPPPVESGRQGISEEQGIQRRRLLFGSAMVLAAGAMAWGVYLYIASAPMRADKVFQEGMRLTGTGDLKRAEQRFSEAIGIYPSLAGAYLQRGLAREGLHQMDAAIEDFERALSQDSSLASAHTGLGVIYRERGDPARAMNEFNLAIHLNPNADAFYQRGQLYESQGRHQQAIEDYAAAIHEQPDAPYVYRARAMARDAMGDHDGAEEDRQAAAEIESRGPSRR